MSVCVLGSINLDLVLAITDLPKPGQTLPAQGFSEHPGGKGANQATAAARAGAPTAMLGAVGDDAAGAWMLERLSQAGVDVAAVGRLAGQPTGQAHIMVSAAGENMIVVVGGANLAWRPERLPPEPLCKAKVLLAQLESPVETVRAAFADPATSGALKLLNAAPALAEAAPLFVLCDMILVNETELGVFAGVALDTAEVAVVTASARRLIARAGQWVIVTLGAAGVLAVSAEDALTAPGWNLPVVDTTGAGDCFCGALAARLSEDAPLAEALAFANAAAALSVGRPGAGSGMPARGEIEALLASRSA